MFRLRQAIVWLGRYQGELLTAAAFLGGWALLTWAIATLTHWTAWPFSGAALCFSLGGWRLLYTVARDGLYVLTREGRRG